MTSGGCGADTAKTIVFWDNGCGMDRDDLQAYGTFALRSECREWCCRVPCLCESARGRAVLPVLHVVVRIGVCACERVRSGEGLRLPVTAAQPGGARKGGCPQVDEPYEEEPSQT